MQQQFSTGGHMENQMERARNLLENLTPLKTDCGLTCGAACCQPDEDGQGGVRLFPGEAALYEGADWARIEDGVLICGGRCPRNKRPLGCRIFPLTPARKKSGELFVRIDRRAFAMCPLAPGGRRALDPAFTSQVLQALQWIDETPEGREFLNAWIEGERIFREAVL
jgi:hypothetical protein